ncbi:MAG: ATP-binding cassette domain-containing protein [Phycisphaeraceae bacterium]|nr:ATP-binding cassette domain-containing protein [Phycisphaeraceae bacterium]
MIEVRDVSKRFGSTLAVDGVTLSLEPGRVAGLLGPNGAGKTTLIRMMTSYLAPSTGTITVCGHDTVQEPQASRRVIGYLPESAPLYPEMSVRGYLRFRASLFCADRSRRERLAAVSAAIDRCWIADVVTRRIGVLSKGYRQRVGLAAAILHQPRVLILDEPSSGLDPAQITMMRGLIRDLAADRVVLLSSHILSEVELTCSRVLIVTRGRLRADGSPEELTSRFDPAARFAVEFAAGADAASAERCLRSVPGVARVEFATDRPSSGGGSAPEGPAFTVLGGNDRADLREPIARAARDAGLLVRELSRRRPSLEQVFMSILERGDRTEAAA